ncbi:MAG: M42 family metallopeptidase [Anaerolineae bacterium]|nr:M42 family metallopeptidase [Anaerolineae bacterium]
MKDTIKKLVEAFGPSGYEDQVRAIIKEEIAGLVDEVRVDALGNLIALKKASTAEGVAGKRIMLSAHMDEIGVIVSYVDEKGFLRINPIGGVRTLYEVMGRVRFVNGTVGVIGVDKMDDPNKVPPMDRLFVDVGATSREDCPVKVGDVACFLQPMVEIGKNLTSKAMDDRVACAVLIGALRELSSSHDAGSPHDLYFVFSAQEEVGLRGATTSAYGIMPDLGLAVDVTLSPDTPEPAVKMAVELGKGPAIKVKDGGMLATPWVKEWMIATAEKNGIPYQLEVLLGGSTDARAIQTTQAGVPSGCLSIPTRYVHSPSETVSYADVLNSIKLMVALLSNPIEK